MTRDLVENILKKINTVEIAVCGDFCLDAYWILNPVGGEFSAETGIKAEVVQSHYYRPGGASNIVANLAALNPAHIQAIGVIGNDIFGREQTRQLVLMKIDVTTLFAQNQDFDTYTFGKRYSYGQEQPRIDFGFFNKRSAETDDKILPSLQTAIEKYNVVIFNQQVPGSLNEQFIQKANALFAHYENKIVLLDSRHYGQQFKNIYRKTNTLELTGQKDPPESLLLENAKKVCAQNKRPVFATRGAKGILAVDSNSTHSIPGIPITGPIDIVGAGDTVISALGLCLAAGFDIKTAARFANLAAAVTIKKLFQTGTASGEEMMALAKE